MKTLGRKPPKKEKEHVHNEEDDDMIGCEPCVSCKAKHYRQSLIEVAEELEKCDIAMHGLAKKCRISAGEKE